MKRVLWLFVSGTLLSTILLHATPTTVVVRALARDAKFIGSSIGGAQVIIRNVANGEILAEGKTSGSTGNTKALMSQAHTRYGSLADARSAKFETVIDIDEPTLINIEVSAPLAQRQAMVTATKQLWLIPGKDILGDGIIMEMHGFALDVLKPRTHEMLQLTGKALSIPIEVNLVML